MKINQIFCCQSSHVSTWTLYAHHCLKVNCVVVSQEWSENKPRHECSTNHTTPRIHSSNPASTDTSSFLSQSRLCLDLNSQTSAHHARQMFVSYFGEIVKPTTFCTPGNSFNLLCFLGDTDLFRFAESLPFSLCNIKGIRTHSTQHTWQVFLPCVLSGPQRINWVCKSFDFQIQFRWHQKKSFEGVWTHNYRRISKN